MIANFGAAIDETYDIASEPTPGRRFVLLVDDAGVPSLEPAPEPPAPIGDSSSLPYEDPSRRRAAALRFSWIEGSRGKDLFVPAAIVVCGTLATYARLGVFNGSGDEVARAVGRVGIYTSWNIALMLLGIIISARLLDVGFGLAPQAILKLAALTLGPLGIWQAVALACGGGMFGEIVGWVASVPIYWWLFAWFFDLDFRETMVCLLVITMLRFSAITLWWFGA